MTASSRLWRRVVIAAGALALVLGVAAMVAWVAAGRPGLSQMRAAYLFRQATAATSETQRVSALGRVLELQPLHQQAMLQLAQHELNAGRLEAAFLRFQTIVEAHPAVAQGWLGLAQVRAAAGQPGAASLAADEAVAAGPELVPAHRLRATLCLQTQRNVCAEVAARALSALVPQDPVGASVLEQATSRLVGPAGAPPANAGSPADAAQWPGLLGPRMREFGQHLQRQQWDLAVQLANDAATRWPGTFLGEWLYGVTELSRGRLDEAEQRLQKALVLAPRSHRVLTNLTAVWARKNGPRVAGERLSDIVERDPGAVYAVSIAAQAFLQAREPALAEASLRKAVAASPRSVPAHASLARFLLELDQPDAALDALNTALASMPGQPVLELLRARVLLARGDRSGAQDDCRRVLAKRPDADEAAGLLVLLLLDASGDEGTRATARRQARDLAIRLERNAPIDATAREAIGRSRAAFQNDFDGARGWLSAARDAAPDEPRIRYHLATVLARLGRAPEAVTELRAALEHGQAFAEEADARRLLSSLGAGTTTSGK